MRVYQRPQSSLRWVPSGSAIPTVAREHGPGGLLCRAVALEVYTASHAVPQDDTAVDHIRKHVHWLMHSTAAWKAVWEACQ